MKTLLLIISISAFLLSCDLSFETKLIDEPLANVEKINTSKGHNAISLKINGVSNQDTWFLEMNSKRKLKAILPFQNITVVDSLNSYYVVLLDDKKALLKKSEVILKVTAKVVLDDLSVYSVPDLTKRTEQKFTPGDILLIKAKSLGDFYTVKKETEKTWSFIRKEDSKLSDAPKDLEHAHLIEQIKQGNQDPFIQAKLFEDLKQTEGFNRNEWLPLNETQVDFNDYDEEIL